MALIPPDFLDCVVAIGLDGEMGGVNWVASGFLYAHLTEVIEENQSSYEVLLVTNKHVVEGQSTIHLRFNPVKGEIARQYQLLTTDFNGMPIWEEHDDPNIDIAVVRISANALEEEGIKFSVFRSDKHCANTIKMGELGITEGNYVYVLGFPLGLIGGEKNFVIVRSGGIARIRDTIAKLNNEFLIDTFIFPGNSGGPVISKPELFAFKGTKTQSSAYLIGIVIGFIPYQDIAISQQTKKPRIIFEENSGLAAIHPIDFIEDIIAKIIESHESKTK